MDKIPNQNSILWKYQNPVIIYYHMVTEKTKPYYPDSGINPKIFRSQLIELKKYFNIISLPEALERAKAEKLDKNSMVITIDDGFAECHSVIAPILLEEKIPATFFLIANCIDNKNMMWLNEKQYLKTSVSGIEPVSELLENQKPYLTTQQIQELNNAGFSIGSHSETHPSCDQLGYEELYEEIVDSSISIEKKIDSEVKYFSYPFGRRAKSEYEYKIMENSKLECLIGGKPGLFRKNKSPFWEAYNFERNKSKLLYHLFVNSFF